MSIKVVFCDKINMLPLLMIHTTRTCSRLPVSFWLNLWRDFASMLIDKLHQAENYVTISKQKIHISPYMGLSLIKMICLLGWLTCWYKNLTLRFISLVSDGWMAANMPISLITCLCARGVIIVYSYFHMTEVI